MAQHPQTPPFRAEHVGSLLRPRALMDAWKARRTGKLEQALFKAILQESIADAVRLQEELGFRAVTDGEFQRASYWSHFVDAVDGLAVGDPLYDFREEPEGAPGFTAPLATGKLARSRPISGTEFDLLNGLTARLPKITLPSPSTMHFWRGAETVLDGAYPDEEAYFADLARIYREEIADLAERGCRYLQFDEVPLAMLCHPAVRARIAAGGRNPEALAHRYAALIDESIRDRPAGMTVALHLGRGSERDDSPTPDGYGFVAERLFAGTAVDIFFLACDGADAGGFAALRHLPSSKTAVLGLVSTRSPELEPADDLVRRIEDAAGHAPLERLALSPACGFAPSLDESPLTADDQRRKLELVVQVAQRVWGGP